jgi:hypothetical protein
MSIGSNLLELIHYLPYMLFLYQSQCTVRINNSGLGLYKQSHQYRTCYDCQIVKLLSLHSPQTPETKVRENFYSTQRSRPTLELPLVKCYRLLTSSRVQDGPCVSCYYNVSGVPVANIETNHKLLNLPHPNSGN